MQRLASARKTEAKLESAIEGAGNGGTVKLSCASPTTIRFTKPK